MKADTQLEVNDLIVETLGDISDHLYWHSVVWGRGYQSIKF